jgi:hypothetical protein
MADQNQTPPAAPPAQANFVVSSHYRVIHSNFFRYRLNIGEMMIHFDTVTDTGLPGTSGNTSNVIAEASLAMSWAQIKNLHRTLGVVISVIEKEIGPITIPEAKSADVKAEETRVTNLLNSLYSRSKK